MILMFGRVYAGKRQRGQVFVPTWVFVGAYLMVWALFGALAYVLAVGAERLADRSMWLMDHATRIGGVVLLAAGLYQLSPIKSACLTTCRTPFQFVLGSWRDGYGGALRMGLEHGAYCLGCCWLLFVILFPLGVMNVAAMALVTALIFAEKSLPIGRQIGTVAAVALIAYGALVIFVPGALPTMM
jgi:predicted metal-binding membrane protein